MDASIKRHEAIASNIANVNTPGYQRQDLSADFQTAMSTALAKLDSGDRTATSPRATIGLDPSAKLERYDGNSVNMDKEMGMLMENSTMHQFVAEYINKRYEGMRSAMGTGGEA